MAGISDIIKVIETAAPLAVQEEWDNSGLQILCDENPARALTCLDVTEEVMAEAKKKGCTLIVSHHPLFFKGIKGITGKTIPERCAAEAIRSGISIYSAHTSLDNAAGGVSWRMASMLGLENVRSLCDNGGGAVGVFPSGMPATDFLTLVKRTFDVKCICHNRFRGTIKKVALCGGAGAFMIEDAMNAGADAFLTGDLKYHDYFGYEDRMLLCDIGHYQSEHCTVRLIADILRGIEGLEVLESELDTNPVDYFILDGASS